jgi:hypothetical protein
MTMNVNAGILAALKDKFGIRGDILHSRPILG